MDKKFKAIQGKRIKYKLNHHLTTKSSHFDSWMVLCEYVMDVAEAEATKQMQKMISDIADEIIATAEEYDGDWVLYRVVSSGVCVLNWNDDQ